MLFNIIRTIWNCTASCLDYYFCRLKLLCADPIGPASTAAGLLGLWTGIPPTALSLVKCCVSSGRGLCVRLIDRPEDSHRLCWLSVIFQPRLWEDPGPQGAVMPWGGGGGNCLVRRQPLTPNYHEISLLPPVAPATCRLLGVWCGCSGWETWSSQPVLCQRHSDGTRSWQTCGLSARTASCQSVAKCVVSSQRTPSADLETAWPQTEQQLQHGTSQEMYEQHNIQARSCDY